MLNQQGVDEFFSDLSLTHLPKTGTASHPEECAQKLNQAWNIEHVTVSRSLKKETGGCYWDDRCFSKEEFVLSQAEYGQTEKDPRTDCRTGRGGRDAGIGCRQGYGRGLCRING
jgi:hypothetical protein